MRQQRAKNRFAGARAISQILFCLRERALSTLLLINRFPPPPSGWPAKPVSSISRPSVARTERDYIADGTCNMSELRAVFQMIISAQFVFDMHTRAHTHTRISLITLRLLFCNFITARARAPPILAIQLLAPPPIMPPRPRNE